MKYITLIQSPPAKSNFQIDKYLDPQLVIPFVILLGVLFFFKGSKKGQLTTGRLAAATDKANASNLATKQIKQRKHNKVAFWCGTPQYYFGKKWLLPLHNILGKSPSVWFPHAERSSLVLGSPGSGKTYGTIDRLMESCIIQGFPLIVYAKKEEQMKFVASFAAKNGYDVRVFAPGEEYSETINPLDFLKDEEDQVVAGQIAEVINNNTNGGANKGGDPFFDKAAILLVKALIQLAKMAESMPEYADCADLSTVSALLKVEDFIKKLDYAISENHIPRWIATSFQQYISSIKSERTVASIDTTTVGIFSKFIQKSLLPSFIGPTSIPTNLRGKQILIFKLDDENRDVVGPLLAAALHMTVVKNLSSPRQDPLGIFLDELPSLFLKSLPQWINEYRSNGACFVLGVQSIKQLVDAYGDNLARSIISACSTKVLYNPGDYQTAKEFSDTYGQTEKVIKNKSVSNNREGRNITINENLQTMPLITPDEIMQLPQGHCIITNPGYGVSSRMSVPYRLKIFISKADDARISTCERIWDDVLRDKLIQRRQKQTNYNGDFNAYMDDQMNRRDQLAVKLLHPDDEDEIISSEDEDDSDFY